MTDVELDERVTALEENGGGGSSQNGYITNVHFTWMKIFEFLYVDIAIDFL